MNNPKTSSADHVDNHRRLLFLSMLLLSLTFAVKTGSFLVGEDMKSYLAIAGKGIAGLFFVFLVLTVFWKWRFIPWRERYLLNSTDSFAMEAMGQACKTSWFLTFALLVLFTTTTKKDYSAFPAEFYLNGALFCMLAAFSVSFFLRFRGSAEEEEHQNAEI